MKKNSGWRPISEAPKDGSFILTWNGYFYVLGVWVSYSKVWAQACVGKMKPQPTHFMPLPAPPQTEEK